MHRVVKVTRILPPIVRMSTYTQLDFTKVERRSLAPKLTHELHKGQCGRIGVIGGSREYTGAPYFAAMTTLRLGADLAHVFCSEAAGTAIKGYSPDLIVHPIMDDENALDQVKTWLPRLHAVVVGPGLGRDNKIMKLVQDILIVLKEMKKLTIIDADGLHILTENPDILNNFQNVIITPNAVEYERLVTAVSNDTCDVDENYLTEKYKDLVVVRKGHVDKISTCGYLTYVDETSCPRRCGGQGDILSGAIGLFSYWAHMAEAEHANLLGAHCGCFFTKHLFRVTYNQQSRRMVTGDCFERIHTIFREYFERKDY